MKVLFMGTAADERIPAMYCNCETCQKALKLGGKSVMTRAQALIDNKLLIDFGGDTYAHFLAQNRTLWDIENILITHSHGDHLTYDSLGARCHWFTAERTKYPAIKMYAHQDVINKFRRVFTEEAGEGGMKFISEFFKLIPVQEFVSFSVDEYLVTPLPAMHTKGEASVIYLIEKGNKAILYGTDTGFFDETIDNWLAENKKHIDLIAWDCTKGDKESPYWGHMSMSEGKTITNRFLEKGIIDDKTLLYYTHFSHGCGMVYDELQAVAKDKYAFNVAHDGLQVEI